MRRLLLIRHATTPAVKAAAFGADEDLDAAGTDAAASLNGHLPHRAEGLSSPARRARQTAAAAGLEVRVEERLAECDFGAWAGRRLADVHAEDPAGVEAWMADPAAAPHGGESLEALLGRVDGWLAEQAAQDGTAVAVTHGGVVKAAVVRALDAAPAAFWRIDASPVGITELHAHDGRWTLARVNERPGGLVA